MKALITTVTVFVAGMFLTTVALAGDVDDVKALEMLHMSTQSVDVNVQLHLEGHTGFGSNGGLLERYDSLEDERKESQAEADTGLRRNLQLRHLEVEIYGNLVAVSTSYMVVTITFPDGTTQQIANRRTGVLIKQGGQWKEVHHHGSPLRLSQ